MDLTRLIEPHLAPDSLTKVKILEGVRASGKTTVARHLRAAGLYDDYVDLADPAVLARAQADPPGWLGALAPRAIIDEAQLFPDLPLYLKTMVDEVGTPRRFLLTGSASLGRTSLGGSDPLTGRVERWTLNPLLPCEVAGQPEHLTALIDALQSSPPTCEMDWPAPNATIEQRTLSSGFPTLALESISAPRQDRWLRDLTLGLLTEHVLPGERYDTAGALRVLDGCLRNPAGILNVTALANRLTMDARTVDRYLDILERRFLLRYLPNLATSAGRQTRRRAKVHPIDTGLATESLRRADPRWPLQPESLGQLFESYVVNQIMTAAALIDPPLSAFYWRTPKGDREVDLVLVSTSGQAVGFEVKVSSVVRPDDAKGLIALAQARDLQSGYIVYAGHRLVRLTNQIWGLPVDALVAPADPPAPLDNL